MSFKAMMRKTWREHWIRMRIPLACLLSGVVLSIVGLALIFAEYKLLGVEKFIPHWASQALMVFDTMLVIAGQGVITMGLFFYTFTPSKLRWEIKQL